MNPLNSIEIKLCQQQAKIFEASVVETSCSSKIFIRRFMYSSVAKSMDSKMYLFTSETANDAFKTIDDEFGYSKYGKEKFSQDQMFWIGYIYRCLSIKYNLSSKSVYKLFNADKIVDYYNICHTFDIVDAAERMMESINYDNSSIEDKAYKNMKRIVYTDKLQTYLGKEIVVTIDRPIGYVHNGMTYTQNYGYMKDIISLDGEYQDVYILGTDIPLEHVTGKVIAIINRTNDIEDKLVVSTDDKKYTKKQILDALNFQEQYFKSKVIMN